VDDGWNASGQKKRRTSRHDDEYVKPILTHAYLPMYLCTKPSFMLAMPSATYIWVCAKYQWYAHVCRDENVRRFEWQKVNKVYFFGSLALVTIVVLASFVGYVCWSWISKVGSFRETLQKDGFTIIQATSWPIPSFLWLPPRTSITCQNQTQFINEARSLKTTGQLLEGNFIYQLDTFQFYAVTSDIDSAYEYTLPHPIFLNALLIVMDFSPLVIFAFFVVLIIIGLVAIPLLMARIIKKRRTRSTR
jgi:hypothetical protein